MIATAERLPGRAPAIVAIPACNEAARIEACLSALATQRDRCGAPIPIGSFEILLYANNCTDDTVPLAAAFAEICPHPIEVVAARHPPERANAGWARKAALDLAADRLEAAMYADGILLTTDADSIVSPTWFSETTAELADGTDCVAGYIDALPAEIMRLGARFVRRSRLEDRYLRLVAEIYARCDPRPHDPWPNHRVSSGASLAVSLRAYRAVGGLPTVALGEDVAFTRRLEAAGFRVRHSLDVTVATSCRFDGRAAGGAADTMRLRHAVDEAPCDDEVEPARRVLWRALLQGGLRRAHTAGTLHHPTWPRRLGLGVTRWQGLQEDCAGLAFDGLWQRLSAEHPALRRCRPLQPADLPSETAQAEAILLRLRARPLKPVLEAVPTGMHPPQASPIAALA